MNYSKKKRKNVELKRIKSFDPSLLCGIQKYSPKAVTAGHRKRFTYSKKWN